MWLGHSSCGPTMPRAFLIPPTARHRAPTPVVAHIRHDCSMQLENIHKHIKETLSSKLDSHSSKAYQLRKVGRSDVRATPDPLPPRSGGARHLRIHDLSALQLFHRGQPSSDGCLGIEEFRWEGGTCYRGFPCSQGVLVLSTGSPSGFDHRVAMEDFGIQLDDDSLLAFFATVRMARA